MLDETITAARQCGDEGTAAVATVVRATAASHTGDSSVRFETAMEVADRAIVVLEQIGNDEQLAQMLHDAAAFRASLGRADEAARLYQSGLEHARRAHDLYRARACFGGILGSKTWGSASVSEFFAFLDGIPTELRPLRSGSRFYPALMAAYSGDFARAHDEYAEAQRFATRFSNPVVAAALTTILGIIELLEDDPVAAERTLRDGYERLDELGARGLLVTSATRLAEALRRQGRDEEAGLILDVADELAHADDFDAQVGSLSVRARILARKGELAEADRLSRKALEIVSATDAIVLHGETLVTRAEVLRAAGSLSESEAALGRALELFERKENVVQAGRTPNPAPHKPCAGRPSSSLTRDVLIGVPG